MMDWTAWIGIGLAFMGNLALLAYQAGQINRKVDTIERDVSNIQEELKEYRPLSGDIKVVKEVLQRVEVRFDQLIERIYLEKKKD